MLRLGGGLLRQVAYFGGIPQAQYSRLSPLPIFPPYPLEHPRPCSRAGRMWCGQEGLLGCTREGGDPQRTCSGWGSPPPSGVLWRSPPGQVQPVAPLPILSFLFQERLRPCQCATHVQCGSTRLLGCTEEGGDPQSTCSGWVARVRFRALPNPPRLVQPVAALARLAALFIPTTPIGLVNATHVQRRSARLLLGVYEGRGEGGKEHALAGAPPPPVCAHRPPRV